MKVRAFRASHQANTPGTYNGWVHLTALMVSCILVMTTVWPLIHFGLAEYLMIPIAFLISNLVEYTAHRWPMHRKIVRLIKPYKRHAGEHHRFFTDERMISESHKDFHVILMSKSTIAALIFLAIIPVSMLIWWLGTISLAATFFFVAIAYYGVSEFLHISFHHERVRQWPIVKQLRRTHTVHHDTKLMKDYNFNIAFPIFDIVFGTYI